MEVAPLVGVLNGVGDAWGAPVWGPGREVVRVLVGGEGLAGAEDVEIAGFGDEVFGHAFVDVADGFRIVHVEVRSFGREG